MGREQGAAAYVACVPHVPLLSMQPRDENTDLWSAYEARIREFEAFDPELVIAFGADHYSNIHLKLAPSFLIGHAATAINDCGGMPGELDVPMALSETLARNLIDNEFDVAVSYDMSVDHGFSNVLSFFLRGKLDARPVIPVHINALTEPRPTLRRCRRLGEAVGLWARTLGKRVAFIGSGGLSHETSGIFPQYHTASTPELQDYIVHGEGTALSHDWHENIRILMEKVSACLSSGEKLSTTVRADWDRKFLDQLSSGPLEAFDGWTDEDIIPLGGTGAGESRMWIAAVAAGKAAGVGEVHVDYYSPSTTVGVGAGVVHAPAMAG